MRLLLTWLLVLATPLVAKAGVREATNIAPSSVTAVTTGLMQATRTIENRARQIRDRRVIVDNRTRAYHVRPARPWRAVRLAISWLLVTLVIGFAVISYAGDKVEIVVNTIRDGVGKSIFSGLLGHLAIVPGAVGVVVLLGATIIGILVIPLGLVAYMIVVSGLAMFGFIAVALLTGAALTGRKTRDETPRGAMLRAFVIGTLAFVGLWIVAAALSWMPLLGALIRAFAAGATFVAVTAGFGAVIRSYWRGDFSKRAATA